MLQMPILGLRTTDEVILFYGERHGKESQEGDEDNEKEEEQEEVAESIRIPSFVVLNQSFETNQKPS